MNNSSIALPFPESNNDRDRTVLPVFSDAAYAKRGAKSRHDEFPVAAISLQIFKEVLLPADNEAGRLVGPNWDGNMAGSEVEPKELLERIRSALEGLQADS